MATITPNVLNPVVFEVPEPPEEFGQDGGKFYRSYDSLAEEIDEDSTNGLKEQLDGLLVFVGFRRPTPMHYPLTRGYNWDSAGWSFRRGQFRFPRPDSSSPVGRPCRRYQRPPDTEQCNSDAIGNGPE